MMRCVASALLLIAAGALLPACGSSTHSTTTASSATARRTTAAATPTASTATGPDGKCANAVPAAVAPPAGQWPTPTGYLAYRQAARAAAAALHSVSSAKVAAGARQVAKAGADYRTAASQTPGGPNAPYSVARATVALEAAARVAASAGLPACTKALQRLALDASGTLGQPANPGSCGPGNVPVLGGCVSIKVL